MPTIVDLYRQHGVAHEPGTAGWVNCLCPFCGGTKLKLGFNTSSRSFFCWQCRGHRADEALSRLLGVDQEQARDLWRSLGGAPTGGGLLRDRRAQARVRTSSYHRPQGTLDGLTASHARYLERRGFDPERIASEWGVTSTGPTSRLDGVDYRNRLLVPITWNGAEVSFQARDVTGRSDRKYMACPGPRELVHHKHILYGRQEAWRAGLAIAVEGVTDAWRLGPLAMAVFGVQYRPEQVLEMVRHLDRVAVVFDPEPGAQRQARRLVGQLRASGVASEAMGCGDTDPGGMSEDDAAYLVREIRRWGQRPRRAQERAGSCGAAEGHRGAT